MISDKLIQQLVNSINYKQESLIAPIQREYQQYVNDLAILEKAIESVRCLYGRNDFQKRLPNEG